jgi:hypothetical protein
MAESTTRDWPLPSNELLKKHRANHAHLEMKLHNSTRSGCSRRPDGLQCPAVIMRLPPPPSNSWRPRGSQTRGRIALDPPEEVILAVVGPGWFRLDELTRGCLGPDTTRARFTPTRDRYFTAPRG